MSRTILPGAPILIRIAVEQLMSRVEEIEEAIKNLPAKDLRRFRRWFADFDAEVWDAQIEADAASGKLDALASTALSDYEKGRADEF